MKYIFEATLFAYFVAAFANSSVKPTETTETKKALCNVNNYNSFYTGPNCKNIEQHLEKINKEIEALKGNKTGGPGENGLSSQVRKQLIEIKQEIRALKENLAGGHGESGLFIEMKQQLVDIKQEIRALKENKTSTGEIDLSSEMKQQFAEIKQEIRAFKVNQTGGAGGNGLSKEMKQQLVEIKQEIRALKKNLTGCSSVKVYSNCAELYKSGKKVSGVYKIDPDGLGEFEVYCDQTTAGGGWTVFQKRMDGSVDFYRGWDDYKRGFGKLTGEFWLGLDKIHRLTASSGNKLRVDLEDVQRNTAFAEYSSFAVAGENAKYTLSLGSYSGTAGDSLSYHRGQAFTTKDRDNDKWQKNCASDNSKGGWWYNNCHHSNLNGLYKPGQGGSEGMAWKHWKMWISVKRSEMKIRPKDF